MSSRRHSAISQSLEPTTGVEANFISLFNLGKALTQFQPPLDSRAAVFLPV